MLTRINDRLRGNPAGTALLYGAAVAVVWLLLAPSHRLALALIAGAISSAAWVVLRHGGTARLGGRGIAGVVVVVTVLALLVVGALVLR